MRKVLILAAVVAAGVVGWLVWRQGRTPPLVVSGFIEADEIRVGSRVGGRVAEVLVSEGQRVKAGDVLFRIEPFDLQQKLARAQGEAMAAKAEYARLKAGYRPEEVTQAEARRDRLAATLAKAEAGPRPGEIDIARQKVVVAQANVELATIEQKRMAQMAPQGTASEIEIDRANRELKASRAEELGAEQELALLKEGTRKEELAEARAALAEAEAALKLMKQGYRAEDIEQAAAKAAAAEADVEAFRSQVQELTVAAPGDCIVEAIDLRPGDLVAPNGPAVSLLDTSRMWVRTYVPEGKLGRVKLGGKVPIRVDGFGERRFDGRVDFIASEGEFTPRNIQTPEERSKQVFRTKITLGEGKAELRVGMMADVLWDEAGG